tara:strand:- start:702 stop:1127 length:426 start_codon:yes stop_codon:yes gene_type:complete
MEARAKTMSWLLIKTYLKKCYIWLKEYWQIPFLVFWSILVYIMTRRNTEALVEVLETRKESYKKQMEILKNNHNNELLRRDRLLATYQEALDKLEKKYLDRKEELTDLQKNQVKEIVIKSKGNPEEIKKIIQEEFGIFYVD